MVLKAQQQTCYFSAKAQQQTHIFSAKAQQQTCYFSAKSTTTNRLFYNNSFAFFKA